MSAENIAIVRRAFERWNRDERDASQAELDPDVELHSLILGRVLRGIDGFQAWMDEIDERFEEWRLEISDLREVGVDRLLVIGAVRIRGRGSKVATDQPMAWLVDFRDARILRMQMFPNRADAFEVAGVLP